MPQMPAVITPTPEQLKKWNQCRTALVWYAPAFTHIFYTMMSKNNGDYVAMFTTEVPVAATDGVNVLINPETFFKYSLSEQVFICCHEILHGIFGHVELMHKLQRQGKVPYPDGKQLPFDNPTFQKAMDYVNNAILVEGKTGSCPKDALFDTTIATHNDSVLTAYRRIYQQDQKNGGSGGSGSGQKSFDVHLAPGTSQGKDPGQAIAERSDIEWKTAIAAAAASAKAQGKLPASLERLLVEELEPKVDWTDMVTGWFARKTGGGTYDWRRPDRRFIVRGIIAPARTGFGCGPLVVGIDTSGSIDDDILARFFAEMSGILSDIRPSSIHVMWCDAKVHRVDEIEDGGDLQQLRAKKAPGGGGTSFKPVFDEIAKLDLQPDALIYLTDGYGTFPKEKPSYPVLWGDITGQQSQYPFGDYVHVPLK